MPAAALSNGQRLVQSNPSAHVSSSSSIANRQVTVLGGGIVGVCCTLSLQSRGYEVTLIDQQEPGEATSYGNAGVVSPWSCVPNCMPGLMSSLPGWLLRSDGPVCFRWQDLPTTIPWVLKFLSNSKPEKVEHIADAMADLIRSNISLYRQHLNGTRHENLLQDSWHVNAFRGQPALSLNDLAWKLRIDRGAPVEILTGDELREIEPDISEEYGAAIIFKQQSRALAPGRLCKVLAAKAFAQGAKFERAHIETLNRQTDGSYELHGSGKSFTARKLVIAAGFWSADIVAQLGIKLPLISERGYHLEFPNADVVVNNSVLDVTGKYIVSTMESGVRAAGTAEFARHDAPANDARADMLAAQTRRLLPGLNTEGAKRWMGVRPTFPDNLPAIGALSGHPHVFAAFGHSHWGLGMAPGTGERIAEMMSDDYTNRDANPYSPDRFT